MIAGKRNLACWLCAALVWLSAGPAAHQALATVATGGPGARSAPLAGTPAAVNLALPASSLPSGDLSQGLSPAALGQVGLPDPSLGRQENLDGAPSPTIAAGDSALAANLVALPDLAATTPRTTSLDAAAPHGRDLAATAHPEGSANRAADRDADPAATAPEDKPSLLDRLGKHVEVLRSGPVQSLRVNLNAFFDETGDAPEEPARLPPNFGGKTPVLVLVGGGGLPGSEFYRPWMTRRTQQAIARLRAHIPGLELVVVDSVRPEGVPADRFVELDINKLSNNEPDDAAFAAPARQVVEFLARNNLAGLAASSILNTYSVLASAVQAGLRTALPGVLANPFQAVRATTQKDNWRELLQDLAPEVNVWARRVNDAEATPEATEESGAVLFGRLQRAHPGAEAILKPTTGAGKAGNRKNLASEDQVREAVRSILREFEGIWRTHENLRNLHTVSAALIMERMIRGVSEADVEFIFGALRDGFVEVLVTVIGNPKLVASTSAEKGMTFPALYDEALQRQVILAALLARLVIWQAYHAAPVGPAHMEVIVERAAQGAGRGLAALAIEDNGPRPVGATGVEDLFEAYGLDIVENLWRAYLGLPLLAPEREPQVFVRRKILPGQNGTLERVLLDGRPVPVGADIDLAPGIQLLITKAPGQAAYAAGTELGAQEKVYSDDIIGRLKVKAVGDLYRTQEEAIAAAYAALERVTAYIRTEDGRIIGQTGAAFQALDDEIRVSADPTATAGEADREAPKETGPPAEAGTLIDATIDVVNAEGAVVNTKPLAAGRPVELAPGVTFHLKKRQARLRFESWSGLRSLLTWLGFAAALAPTFLVLPLAGALGLSLVALIGFLFWATRVELGEAARLDAEPGILRAAAGEDVVGHTEVRTSDPTALAAAYAALDRIRFRVITPDHVIHERRGSELRSLAHEFRLAGLSLPEKPAPKAAGPIDEETRARRKAILDLYFWAQLGNKAIFSMYYPLFSYVMKILAGPGAVGPARNGYAGAVAVASPFAGVLVEWFSLRTILIGGIAARAVIWAGLLPLALFFLGATWPLPLALAALMFLDGLIVSFTNVGDMDESGMELLAKQYDFPLDHETRNYYNSRYESFGAKAQFIIPTMVAVAGALASFFLLPVAWAFVGAMALAFLLPALWSIFHYRQIPKPIHVSGAGGKTFGDVWRSFKGGIMTARIIPQIGGRILFDAGERTTWNGLRLLDLPMLAAAAVLALQWSDAWGPLVTTALIGLSMIGAIAGTKHMKEKWPAPKAGEPAFPAFKPFFPMMLKATLLSGLIPLGFLLISGGTPALVALGLAVAALGGIMFSRHYTGAMLGARYMRQEAVSRYNVAGRASGITASVHMAVDAVFILGLGLTFMLLPPLAAFMVTWGVRVAIGLFSKYLAPQVLFTAEERAAK